MKIQTSHLQIQGKKTPLKTVAPAKSSNPTNPELIKLKKACKNFESIFISYVLKNMRKGTEESGLFGDGLGSKVYTEMFDEKLADQMAETGQLKIGDMLYKQYESLIQGQKDAPQNDAVACKPEAKESLMPLPSQKIHVKKIAIPLKPKQEKIVNLAPVTAAPNTAAPIFENKTEIKPDNTKVAIVNKDQSAKKIKSHDENKKSMSILAEYEQTIGAAAEKFGLNPDLIKAVIHHESGGDPNAVSSHGAKGLMQLIDSTSAMMGVIDPLNPIENIMGGAKYLAALMKKFSGDIEKALASYNAGPGAVVKYGGIPPYPETQNYVQKVLGTFKSATNDNKK